MLLVIDGANRLTAVRKLIENGDLKPDFQIPFTIVKFKDLNEMSNEELIEFISKINEYDPRWTELQHFEAANASGLLTAMKFKIYLKKYEEQKDRVTYKKNDKKFSNNLKMNVLYSIATKKPISQGVSTMTFKKFRDDQIGNYMETDEFDVDFNCLVDYLEIVKHWHVHHDVRISKSLFHLTAILYGSETTTVKFPKLIEKLKATHDMPTTESEIKPFLLNLLF
jgi:hypothetical protein